jgi:hypothetical protein
MPVGHADDRLASPLYPVQNLLVLDLEFGVTLCLATDLLPVGVLRMQPEKAEVLEALDRTA